VALVRWARRRDVRRGDVAQRLGLRTQTLRRWEREWTDNRLVLTPRGRPARRGDRKLRNDLLCIFALIGPSLGIPTLRELFPDVARAELEELARRCKRIVHRKRGQVLVHQLRWTRPGAVWAIDFLKPPRPIDGLYPYLFCVRDLASGKQLLALPCLDETSTTARSALHAVCKAYEPPLVLKCDNGSAFIAAEFQGWAKNRGCCMLYSPPSYPQYNGAVESGQGALRCRTHWEAARQGRPGEWSSDDVEAARLHANATMRPRGLAKGTPNDLWTFRNRLRSTERQRFHEACGNHVHHERRDRGILWGIELPHRLKSQIDRIAISRALIDERFLAIRRRKVSLPLSKARTGFVS
jgi:transposase InsO family protein